MINSSRLQLKFTLQIKYLLFSDGIKLDFDDNALNYIVSKAMEFKLGARGLRSICETILIDDMFNLPGSNKKNLYIDKNHIDSKLKGLNFSGLKEAS